MNGVEGAKARWRNGDLSLRNVELLHQDAGGVRTGNEHCIGQLQVVGLPLEQEPRLGGCEPGFEAKGVMNHGDNRGLNRAQTRGVDRAEDKAIDDQRHVRRKGCHSGNCGGGFVGAGVWKTGTQFNVFYRASVPTQRLQQFIFVDVAAGLLCGITRNGKGCRTLWCFFGHRASCSLAKVLRILRSSQWTAV